ncbi:cell division protein [Caballeronia sordidicola]|uniref:Cell division protein n=1 Tax=Caballeronia sordidicola TaxID=196367 RepID=A0A158HNH6_CABSO|nr:translesion DNA synthesis-associated protein ImuA [Caballeronia sordidicola]SAL45826.1 cell division protein [Caballeronia sordidicola]
MSALSDYEKIHPSLWRGSQLARTARRVIDTGYEALSAELPGGGWPVSTLVEFLTAQSGIGEMRILRPTLASLAGKPIALIQPPQVPNIQAFMYMGIDSSKLVWITPKKTADALWSAEQILKAGSFGAVLFWQQHIRGESLRRLILAAQSNETLFVLMRPLASAQDSSPASLRLALRPAENGVAVEVIKRKGPIGNGSFVLPVDPAPSLVSSFGRRSREFLVREAGTSPIVTPADVSAP